ncbi:ABC transporter ATP-binding protein [Alicyclobacillaceae bacterium I2511]|nr:ABC transporter ATP-binding protein [Alicyclobacillaceae bacterium I2511]
MLEVKDLWVTYKSRHGRPVTAVRGVQLTIPDNMFIGLVGESGCGKSTLGFAIARLLDGRRNEVTGSVVLNGVDLLKLDVRELRALRWKKLSVVLQGGMNAFNPVHKIQQQFMDAMRAHGNFTVAEMTERIADLLKQVQLDREVMEMYPHELSGGMKQRAAIALSLVLDPELVILDEPTTALDVVVQHAIVDMLKNLQRRLRFSVLFISHDLGLVLEVAQRVVVMYAGEIVEERTTATLLQKAMHPYTQALLDCYVDPQAEEVHLAGIPGTPPDLSLPLHGCAFAPRCAKVFAACLNQTPGLTFGVDGFVQCHLYTPQGGTTDEP